MREGQWAAARAAAHAHLVWKTHRARDQGRRVRGGPRAPCMEKHRARGAMGRRARGGLRASCMQQHNTMREGPGPPRARRRPGAS
eukprot:3913069-Pyramimonas_sp.AAC.1